MALKLKEIQAVVQTQNSKSPLVTNIYNIYKENVTSYTQSCTQQ